MRVKSLVMLCLIGGVHMTGGTSSWPFVIILNMSLLPKFNEKALDKFFSLFQAYCGYTGLACR